MLHNNIQMTFLLPPASTVDTDKLYHMYKNGTGLLGTTSEILFAVIRSKNKNNQ